MGSVFSTGSESSGRGIFLTGAIVFAAGVGIYYYYTQKSGTMKSNSLP